MSNHSAGLRILGTYEMDLAKVVAAQQELAKAQKLLDLPISVHLDLINVQKDMKGLRQIYDIYEAQKVGELKWLIEIYFFLILLKYFPSLFVTSFRMQSPSGPRHCGWI